MTEQFDPDKLDREYLKNPAPLIKLFAPTLPRIQDFGRKLADNYLYTSEEMRTKEKITAIIGYYFPYVLNYSAKPFNVWFEIGDWGGLLGFIDILPGYKASALLKLWDKSLWGPTLARGLKELSTRFMREYKLRRVGLMTADEQMRDLATKFCGFKQEGTQKYGFKWGEELRTLYLLRKILDEDGQEG